jgi:hypothetical protein
MTPDEETGENSALNQDFYSNFATGAQHAGPPTEEQKNRGTESINDDLTASL